ncbi:Na(+)/H(+) antiporter [Verticillium alfalfae VaMs.102]|uniref:Na(+)/H(+) antiporter n=1 Tax=Verticillium alfalfae (strain VaMs.102 / ATCC MYA-4576 / FGSC 10136) TaxID=526221 RepID=C9SNX5_VERA1|nr:Na(+)/H(+) antiporter [Verticillium alfalfae VaMs.102]EEY20490.1 Na(+)/H(+) antiporter [Verticillium alfalfae VaMs.102]
MALDSTFSFTGTTFDLAVTGLGGWLLVFGPFSSFFKDRLYLSVACLSFLAGLVFARSTGLVEPVHFTEHGNIDEVAATTLDLSRIVLGVQLLFAGVSLPRRFLRTEWKPLSLLLGPGMSAMWGCSTAVIWLLVPGLSLIHAMTIAACITPTDPILSATVLEGRFADQNVSRSLRDLIIAESGANDGLGYLFLFFALDIVKYYPGKIAGASLGEGQLGEALGSFFGNTCLYVVGTSILYGWVVGYAAKLMLQWANSKGHIDRESFVTYSAALALFILGTCGMAGVDDVLACFVAGNALTWDDWFRLETVEDSFQHAMDTLLNTVIFMWIGARSSYRHIHQIEDLRQALFVGYFGPIGISAIFYLCVGLEFLRGLETETGAHGELRRLKELMVTVVWFLVAFSVCIFVSGFDHIVEHSGGPMSRIERPEAYNHVLKRPSPESST